MDEEEVLDALKFIHDRRLTLFNTRRDHEWKILFGTLGLFVACDASLIAEKVELSVPQRCLWSAIVVVLSWACVYYQWELQKRNRNDRSAMNAINKRICELLHFSVDHSAQEYEQNKSDSLWSFKAQMVFLGVIALVSVGLPSLHIVTKKSADGPQAVTVKLENPPKADVREILPQSPLVSPCPGNSGTTSGSGSSPRPGKKD